MLNEHPLTQQDAGNEEAKKHLEHNCEQLGNKKMKSHKLPHRFCYIRKYFCKECRQMFKTFNWEDREDLKQKD